MWQEPVLDVAGGREEGREGGAGDKRSRIGQEDLGSLCNSPDGLL